MVRDPGEPLKGRVRHPTLDPTRPMILEANQRFEPIEWTWRRRVRAAAARLGELVTDHWPLLAAAAALVIVGWTLPSQDRFGYIVCLAVGIPWALLILGPPRGDER